MHQWWANLLTYIYHQTSMRSQESDVPTKTEQINYGKLHNKDMNKLFSRHSWFKVSWLTHCGLVMPYGTGNAGQYWFRSWLVAWRHQAITWTNVDLASTGSSGIYSRVIYLKTQDIKDKVGFHTFEITVSEWLSLTAFLGHQAVRSM